MEYSDLPPALSRSVGQTADSAVYPMGELSAPEGCWITDSTVYPVVIRITENGVGGLTASVSYPGGRPVFFNRPCPPCGPCCC